MPGRAVCNFETKLAAAMIRSIKDILLSTSLLSLVLWMLIFALTPMGLAAGAAFIALAVIVAWSALKYRGKGWPSGIVFAVLSLTIPLWVFAAFWFCERLGFFAP